MTYDVSLLDRVSAPVFGLASGKNGVFLAWNPTLSQVTGIARIDAVGRTPVEVLGPKASTVSLATAGLFHLPGLGLAVLERHGNMLIGTLQDREREAYLGMAAHDLRAPLRNIAYLAEEALHDPAPSKQRDLVGKIGSVARNGMALTSDMVACVQSVGFAEQPMSEVELRPLAERVFATLDPAQLHKLDCDVATLMVEKPVLQIILRNLLDNAVRHGGKTKRHIHIAACPKDDGIQIRVVDNGKGFRDSALTFLSGGEFRMESGYGLLGLRRLIHARGGRIGVEPGEKGKGSAVLVTLPGSFTKENQVAIAS